MMVDFEVLAGLLDEYRQRDMDVAQAYAEVWPDLDGVEAAANEARDAWARAVLAAWPDIAANRGVVERLTAERDEARDEGERFRVERREAARDVGRLILEKRALAAECDTLRTQLGEARSRGERWRRLAVDLTRCEHGRVQGDVCFDCDVAPSQAGRQVGHSLGGTHVVVIPARDFQADPDAWYVSKEKS